MKKKHVIIAVICIAVVIGGYYGIKGIRSLIDLKNYQKQVNDIAISEVDLNKVPDGTYTGKSDVLWVGAEVKVTVKDHKITAIDLVNHRNERGASAEVLPAKVVEAQSLKVDIVSGATASSKNILKAVENALESGIK